MIVSVIMILDVLLLIDIARYIVTAEICGRRSFSDSAPLTAATYVRACPRIHQQSDDETVQT